MKKLAATVLALVVVTLAIPMMPAPVGSEAQAGEGCKTACISTLALCRVACASAEDDCEKECLANDHSRSFCERRCEARQGECNDDCTTIFKGCMVFC